MEKKELVQLWKYLHAHPETSWKETETTAYLMDLFNQNGFQPIAFKKVPGFYVDIGEGKPRIGLRADMDALLQEVNGKLQANHSCGHDAHMTIVTGTMLRLKEKMASKSGTVRAIFQPAEELGNGAVSVVEEGIVDDLDYLFGVHVRPKSEIPFPTSAASLQHGACVFVKGKIKGFDHHGARPHEGVNAIEVGGALMQQLQLIHTPPHVPASVKVTNFHGGTENLNIIPGEATFGLDVRAQTNEVMKYLKEKITRICQSLSELYGVVIDFSFEDDVPAAIIDPEAEEALYTSILQCLGKEHTQKKIRTPGSDDFHFYTLLRPQIKATMLALGADVTPGLHHPAMTFNTDALENGVNILTSACLTVMEKNSTV